MKKILKIIPLIPWWMAGRWLHFDKWFGDRDYDRRTLWDWQFAPPSREGLLLGWLFWLVVLEGVITLIKGLRYLASVRSNE